jgi:hypothetical protein
MMRGTRSILGAGATAAAIAALGLAGSGVAAAATDVTGQKYSDAQSALNSAGFKPVVSTIMGDQKSLSDCVVTRTQQRTVQPPANSSGSATKEMLVSLNCEASVASATQAGNSAASPEGKAAIAAAASASSSSSGG